MAVATEGPQSLPSEAAKSRLRKLSETKADISTLDWIFLRARVESLEPHFRGYKSDPILEEIFYDSSRDRIAAHVSVSQEWLESAPLKRVRTELLILSDAYFSAVVGNRFMNYSGSSGKWGGAASQRQAAETAALCKPWKNK